MAQQKLHPDAQKVCDLIIASGRPPIETLSPPEARKAYLASRAILQPDPEPVAEVVALEAVGPAGPIPLRLRSSPIANCPWLRKEGWRSCAARWPRAVR